MTHPAVVMVDWPRAILIALIALPPLVVLMEAAHRLGSWLGDLLWMLACRLVGRGRAVTRPLPARTPVRIASRSAEGTGPPRRTRHRRRARHQARDRAQVGIPGVAQAAGERPAGPRPVRPGGGVPGAGPPSAARRIC